MVNASLISRLSHAVDLIEQRSKQNRPKKLVTIRCRRDEDTDAARIATSRPIPRIGTLPSWFSSGLILDLAMMRNWPTNARIVTRRLGASPHSRRLPVNECKSYGPGSTRAQCEADHIGHARIAGM